MKVIFCLATLVPMVCGAAGATDLCEQKTQVVVESKKKVMHLCEKGKLIKSHWVNLGQGGMGKRKQGDGKTPLGIYTLSKPRASSSGFTYFIPVGYPTKAQRAKGFTGGAIGIHGPPNYIPQMMVDAAFMTPWTQGCIMVRTLNEIEEIRAWVLKTGARKIVIR